MTTKQFIAQLLFISLLIILFWRMIMPAELAKQNKLAFKKGQAAGWYQYKFDDSVQQVKAVKYYFVGYRVGNSARSVDGNYYVYGPNRLVYDSLKENVYAAYKNDMKITRKQCIITGIYQFKDSAEYARFKPADANKPFVNR